jgi:hypothetical protein
MSNLTLDSDLAAQLRAATQPCWLRDAEGDLVGYFHPGKPSPPKVYARGEVPELSEQEIQRVLAEAGGRSWEEIKRDLERLA